jgi:hypothetical protein
MAQIPIMKGSNLPRRHRSIWLRLILIALGLGMIGAGFVILVPELFIQMGLQVPSALFLPTAFRFTGFLGYLGSGVFLVYVGRRL